MYIYKIIDITIQLEKANDYADLVSLTFHIKDFSKLTYDPLIAKYNFNMQIN